MNILLINPPRLNEIIGNNPSIIEEERGFNPPLGLLYIAAYVQKNSNHKIAVIDAQVEKLSYDKLRTEIENAKPNVIGITAMTMTLIDVIITTKIVKEVNSQIKVILGGPHVNLFPSETISIETVDYLVLGEGEAIFLDLINALDKGLQLENIAGIVYKKNGEIINTGPRPFIKDLDIIPFPARRLTPYKKYSSLLSKGGIVTTVFTSRGCPYKCSFCDRPSLGKVFRARSAKNVVDELEDCVTLGIHDFLVYDDTFTVNKKRVIDICIEIIERKLQIRWDIRARVDTVDEEMILYLKKAGCQGIHYGIEAGSENVLKVLNKGITIKQVKKAFELTKKYKIPTLAYFMIGNPGESIEDIRATLNLMKKLDPDYVHITILTPFPGTQIYKDGLARGIIQRDLWREFAANPGVDFIPPFWNEIFTKVELENILVKGYKSFYLKPKYIFRNLFKLRSLEEFRKKAFAGLKVIFMK
jgi:anaerobic magnesium-protoporphyrin IX monomethyl ester cyclase